MAASRHVRRGTPRAATWLSAALLGVLLAVGARAPQAAADPASPPAPANPAASAPPPSITDVTAQLDALARRSEQLAEQYNAAAADVTAAQQAADQAGQAAGAARAAYSAARGQLAVTVTGRYEASSFQSAGALLASRDGQSYVDTMTTLGVLGVHQSELVAMLDRAKQDADAAASRAQTLLSEAVATRTALLDQRTQVEQSTEQYEAVLATLTTAQRVAYSSRDSVSPSAVTAALAGLFAAPPAAQAAVRFTLEQIGKPYAFGAAGPDSFDCSGLTMAAWGAAGVRLPHLASSQIAYGQRVPSGAPLQPGDLVFFYASLGHVAIYLGNGLIIQAPQAGEDVKVSPLANYSRDVVGATRLA